MRAILVRVGVDQAYGGWNAPVELKTGQFVLVPIPDSDKKAYPPGSARNYDEILTPLADFALAHSVSNLHLPDTLLGRKMHLDPDFDHLTYGDNGTRRGAGIATLTFGDMLVFYAGLRSIAPPHQLVYALVGLFVVKEIVYASDVPLDRRHENAHTRWMPISEKDVIVRGMPGASGRFERCIPIGEWREKAYRVRRDTEEAWGGLNVKNGYIQRSAVPPEFNDAAIFASWLRQSEISLIERNN
ncbi:MAG: hypothetical protein RB191_21625 [Terriglobia bacterium]|nr:hypothetical protein [Terriglobia bacterium]